MLIRFECPRCKEPMKADWERPASGDATLPVIDCPVCKLNFEPAGWVEIPPLAPPPPTVAPPSPEKLLLEERAHIRSVAQFFYLLTAICILIGGAVLISGVTSNPISLAAVVTGGSFLSAAIWFYLIAQIVHIRANTHK